MTIDQRLEQLERQNRRLKRGMMGIVVAGMALLMIGQASPKVGRFDRVEARTISVLDNKGNRAASIDSHEKFGGFLRLEKSDGKDLVYLGWNLNGDGMLVTRTKEGKEIVLLTSDESGGGAISISDKNGSSLIRISANKSTGEGVIGVYNRAGKIKASWP